MKKNELTVNDLDQVTVGRQRVITLDKMRMKLKGCCGIIVASSLLTSPSLFAEIIGTGSLTITAPGYPPDQAGPYAISSLTASSGLNPGSSFETFCLGTQINYSPGSTYSYQISDTVQPSGSPTASPPGVGSPGFVTWGTAWLYSQYRAGLIGDGSNNDGENDALQGLIWYLQGQSTTKPEGVTYSPDSGFYTTFLNDVMSAASKAGVSDTSDANGAFGVYALNLYTGSSSDPTYAQPQLCLVTTPEPTTFLAGTLMLLPFGSSAFRQLRKKFQSA
jgi:hypothetical protein